MRIPCLAIWAVSAVCCQAAAGRITVLCDSPPELSGYAALIEVNGHRILFDAATSPAALQNAVEAAHTTLYNLDAIVISHRHEGHMGGLPLATQMSPLATVYVPDEETGVFGTAPWSRPVLFVQTIFKGHRLMDLPAKLVRVDSTLEILPGVRAIPLGSTFEGAKIRELSLAITVARGQILATSCGHAGIERILAEVKKPVDTFVGGITLANPSEAELSEMFGAFRAVHLHRVAAAYCTGTRTTLALQRAYGGNAIAVRSGTVIDVGG